MLWIFRWKILRLWISDVWLPCVATLLCQLTPCVGPAEAVGRSQTRPVYPQQIMLIKLCNKRRIEEERTPLENDFGSALARQRVFLIDCVEPSCANYSRNENLSTQNHRILVIKKIDFQKRLWPCGGRRPESDPAGGVFGSLFFYISIYDNTCSKFYSSVCSTTGST